MSPRYLTSKQAAEYIGISYQTFRQWKSSGKPMPVSVDFGGACIRYDVKDLDSFMEERKSGHSIAQ